jgi:D-lactate dehydrogenase
MFYDTKPYDRQFFDEANSGYGFDITYYDGRLDRHTVLFARGYAALCGFVNDVVDAETIEILKAGGVELIALRCAGYNNVDLEAAYGNVHVVRVPEYSPHAVAEHSVGLMLALNRKTHKAYYRVRDGNFSINGLLGFDMKGKTAGVIGTGKIGKCIISILKGFAMDIIASDPYPDETFAARAGIRYVPIDELYRLSDIITLHCPLTPQTHHMIDKSAINRMKDGVMIINTGRGKLIKTGALIEGLKSGKIGSAGLDVYEEESGYFFEDFSMSMISDDVLARLLTFPNVIITSHQGFFTTEALANIANTTLGNVQEFFNGGYLRNEVCYRCGAKTCRKKDLQRCF